MARKPKAWRKREYVRRSKLDLKKSLPDGRRKKRKVIPRELGNRCEGRNGGDAFVSRLEHEQMHPDFRFSCLEKSVIYRENTPVVLTKQKQTGALAIQKQSGALAIQKQSEALAIQKQSEALAIQKQSEALAIQKQSEALAIQKQTGALAIQKQSEALAIQKQSEALAIQKQTGALAIQKQSEALAIQKQSEALAIQKQSEALAIQKQSEALAIQKQSEALAIQKQSEALAIQKQTGALAIQKQSEALAIQKQSEALAIQKQTGALAKQKQTVVLTKQKQTDVLLSKQKLTGALAIQKHTGALAIQKQSEALAIQKQTVVLTKQKQTGALAKQKQTVLLTKQKQTDVLLSKQKLTVELTKQKPNEVLPKPSVVLAKQKSETINMSESNKSENPMPLCLNETRLSEIAFTCSTDSMYKNIALISCTTSDIPYNNAKHHNILTEKIQDTLVTKLATLLLPSAIVKSEKKRLRKLTKVNVSPHVETITETRDTLLENCTDALGKSQRIIQEVKCLLTNNKNILRSLSKSEKYFRNKVRGQERAKVIRMKASRNKMEQHLKNNRFVQYFLTNTQKFSSRKLGRKKRKLTSKQEKHVPDNNYRTTESKKHVFTKPDLEKYLSDNAVRVPPIEKNDFKILNTENTEIKNCSNRKQLKRFKYLSNNSDIDTTENCENVSDTEDPYFLKIVQEMEDIFNDNSPRVPPVLIHNETFPTANHKNEPKKNEIQLNNGKRNKLFNENVCTQSECGDIVTKYEASQTGGYKPKSKPKSKPCESSDDVTVLKETFCRPIGNFNPLQNIEKVKLCNIHHLKYTSKSNDPVYNNVDITFMKPKYESLKHITGDGNCLFRAIAYGITNDENDHTAIRQSIVCHRNDQSCKEYICKTRGITAAELEIHIKSKNMNRFSVWGTDIEIATACHLFKTQILTYENTKRWAVFGKEFTNRCIYLDHSSQNHYDVVTDVIHGNADINPVKENTPKIQIFDEVIQGNISQNNSMFDGIGGGKQCFANSMSFLLMLESETNHKIDAEFITDVLVRGNILYTSIISQNPTPTGYLEIFDIPETISFNNKTYIYKSRQLQGYLEYWNYNEEDDDGLTLHEAIEKVLTDYNSCLITFLNTTICVMKKKDMYYSFDPHSRDDQGRIDVLGNAIVHISNSLERMSLFLWNTAESLTDSLINRTNAKHGFSVDGIKFEECTSSQIQDQNSKLSTISSKMKCRNDLAKNEVKNLTSSEPFNMSSKSAQGKSCKRKLNLENLAAHQRKESEIIEPLSDNQQNAVNSMSVEIKRSYVDLCQLTCKSGQLGAGKCDEAWMPCTKNTVNDKENIFDSSLCTKDFQTAIFSDKEMARLRKMSKSDQKKYKANILTKKRYAIDENFKKKKLKHDTEKYASTPELKDRKKYLSKHRYETDEDFKQKKLNQNKQRYQIDEDFKQRKLNQGKKIYQNDEDFKQRKLNQSKHQSKQRYEIDEDFKQRKVNLGKSKYKCDIDFKAKMKQQSKEKYEFDQDFKEKVKQQSKEKYEFDQDFKEKVKQQSKDKYEFDQDFKEKVKQQSKEKYESDQDFQQRVKKQSKQQSKQKYDTDEAFKKVKLSKAKKNTLPKRLNEKILIE
ncbi:unnamed protein product [Owenia fusiformis]|uniref:OTU domain-containing protein n=1 Tax=Owenia fusiformis TaxID=6347 RepID=A0A8J1XUI6_OWEFU|nr:unnamed protein product [Owenia fusiformis]